MGTTARQDSQFAEQMKEYIQINMDSNALDNSIDWISKNLSPEDVFSETDLINWAKNSDCEGIFDKATLEDWAESNGYEKTTA